MHAMIKPHITKDDGAPVGTCANHGTFRQYVCIKCYRELEDKLRMYEAREENEESAQRYQEFTRADWDKDLGPLETQSFNQTSIDDG